MPYRTEKRNLQQLLNDYEEHLKHKEISIKLQDAVCKIFLDHQTSKYQVMVDDIDTENESTDIQINQTAERFIGIRR